MLVGGSECLETLRGRSDSVDRDVLDYKVCEFKVGLCVLWAEKHLEFYNLSTRDFTLIRLNPVVGFLVCEGNRLRVLLLVDRPMVRHGDWR